MELKDQAEPPLWENRTTLRLEGEFALTAIDNDLLSRPSLFVNRRDSRSNHHPNGLRVARRMVVTSSPKLPELIGKRPVEAF